MTNIYIKHDNGEIMEVQNWATLTDYGAMITRALEPDERQRYLALKAIRLRDSEIWRLFHPHPPKPIEHPTHSSAIEDHFSTSSSYGSSKVSKHRSRLPHSSTHRTSYDRPIEVQIQNIPKSPRANKDPAIEISIKDLSKRALLHIIQKACSRDIGALKTATHDELLSLASAILPAKGVRVTVMPSMDPFASCA